MSLELRPLGVACNLSCTYCYQDPLRASGNFRQPYDLERMKAALARAGGPFILFGGEPLLVPVTDLEELWRFGLERNGQNALQTNGALIGDEHMRLFRAYNVDVGISIDGPGELNDLRRDGSLERTRAATARTEAAIERLCREWRPPSLIVTLHRGNATAERLPRLEAWLARLDEIGVHSVRLHLLEVDAPAVRERDALSARENVAALRSLAALQGRLPRMRFDLMDEMKRLLLGDDRGASCVWRACDPYTTESVRGIEGNGQSSNCGRTNKDGVDFIKASEPGYERYLALHATPREHGGCRGCRFFLMCKGQCPGTAEDGDWRNRTEHCAVWMSLYTELERQLVRDGETPLSLQPVRRWLEGRMVAEWTAGRNPPLSALRRDEPGPDAPPPRFCRLAWVSDAARDLWQPRLERVAALSGDLALLRVAGGLAECAAAAVPEARLASLAAEAAARGLRLELGDGPPPGDGSAPGAPWLRAARWALLGGERALASYRRLAAAGEHDGLLALLGVPACCRAFHARLPAGEDPTWAMASARAGAPGEPIAADAGPHRNVLLQRLGLRTAPHPVCALDCAASVSIGAAVLALGRDAGLGEEMGWLEEALGWAASWTALHGIAEIKTPVVRLVTETAGTADRRALHLRGAVDVAAAGRGRGFPYQRPRRARQLRLAP